MRALRDYRSQSTKGAMILINGSSGIAISSLDGSGSAIVWQDDGMMFMLTGEALAVEELLSFAGSVR